MGVCNILQLCEFFFQYFIPLWSLVISVFIAVLVSGWSQFSDSGVPGLRAFWRLESDSWFVSIFLMASLVKTYFARPGPFHAHQHAGTLRVLHFFQQS